MAHPHLHVSRIATAKAVEMNGRLEFAEAIANASVRVFEHSDLRCLGRAEGFREGVQYANQKWIRLLEQAEIKTP